MLMVVHNLDVVGMPVFPAETDTVLIIDSYAMLSRAIAWILYYGSRRTNDEIVFVATFVFSILYAGAIIMGQCSSSLASSHLTRTVPTNGRDLSVLGPTLTALICRPLQI